MLRKAHHETGDEGIFYARRTQPNRQKLNSVADDLGREP